jgi:hypothetical protein
MRSVTYSMNVSLDGYIVGPDGDFNWTAPDEEEVFRFWIATGSVSPAFRLPTTASSMWNDGPLLAAWRSPRTMSSVETDMVCSDGRQEDDKEQEDTLFAA